MHRLIILLVVGVVIYMYCTRCISTCRENYEGSDSVSNICDKIKEHFPSSDINHDCQAVISSTQSTNQHVPQKTVGEYFTYVLTQCYDNCISEPGKDCLKNCVMNKVSNI